jgi:twitching motility protein PilT
MDEKMEQILRSAFQLNASDIHLTVGVPPIFRINGELKSYGKDKLTGNDTKEMAQEIMPKDLWDSFKEIGEQDFSFGIPGVSRFRVNCYHQRGNISIAIRTVPTQLPTLEDLKLPDVIKTITKKPQGLVLVTGPTGSGKSTTLAAMISHMNQNTSKHIITLEDPIEYLHEHSKSIIDQREVGSDTHSFANGLRAALRQDPDVILVGEMRDLDTISIAITAAETGHLVFGTLHTQSAPSTVDRIIDVFPPSQQEQIRVQLASVLVGIVSQRLFPTADGTGRRAATEVLINNPAIANLIRNEKVHQIVNVMQTSKSFGMHTLQMDIQRLLNTGVITRQDAMEYMSEREN